MEWGFVPTKLIPRLEDWNDAATQEGAVQDLFTLVRGLQRPDPLVSNLGSFLSLLLPLLQSASEMSQNVVATALQILLQVLKLVKEAIIPHIDTLLGPLVSRWSDLAVPLRVSVTACMEQLSMAYGIERFMLKLVPLISSSPDWHVKEEGVNFIIFSLLTIRRDGLHRPGNTYRELWPLFHDCLLHPRPRVEFVAVEAYAVLHGMVGDCIMQDLQRLYLEGHGDMLELLHERLTMQELPLLREHGQVEHPMLRRPQCDEASPASSNRQASVEGTPRSKVAVNLFPEFTDSPFRPPTTESVGHFVNQRSSSNASDMTDTPFKAKDMHLNGTTDEEKIRLWLPSAKPDHNLRALKNAGDIELVSLNSAASSVLERQKTAPQCGLISRRKNMAVQSLSHDAVQQPQPDPTTASSASSPDVGNSRSTPLSIGTSTLADDSPLDNLSLLRGKGRRRRLCSGSSHREDDICKLDSDSTIESSTLKSPTAFASPSSPTPTLPVVSATTATAPAPAPPPDQGTSAFSHAYCSLPVKGTDPLSGGLRVAKPRRRNNPVQPAPPPQPAPEDDKDSEQNLTLTALPVTSQSDERRTLLDQNARPIEEIDSKDLKPLHCPSKALQNAMQAIKGSEWRRHFDGLNTIRAVAVHHPQTLAPTLQAVLQAVASSSDNLRSQISKTAVIAIADIVQGVGRGCDPYLDGVVTQLVKKATDSNHFIVEQAEKGVQATIDEASVSRVISALLPLASHKSEKFRSKAAKYIHLCCNKMESAVYSHKDIAKVIQALHALVGDGNFETRHWARYALLSLYRSASSQTDFEKYCSKALTQKQAERLLEAVHKLIAQQEASERESVTKEQLSRVILTPGNIGKRDNPARRQSDETSGQQPRRADSDLPRKKSGAVKAELSAPAAPSTREMEELVAVANDTTVSDWKGRVEALQRLGTVIKKHRKELDRNDKAVTAVLDALLARCSDQHQKVEILALQTLNDALPCVSSTHIPPITLSRILASLTTSLASTTPAVVREASAVLETLSGLVDCPTYLQHLANVLANTTHPKVKVFLLTMAYTMLGTAHASNPEVITKYLLPPCLRLLTDPRSDVRMENNKLLTKCYGLLGDAIYHAASGLPQATVQRLQDLLED